MITWYRKDGKEGGKEEEKEEGRKKREGKEWRRGTHSCRDGSESSAFAIPRSES